MVSVVSTFVAVVLIADTGTWSCLSTLADSATFRLDFNFRSLGFHRLSALLKCSLIQ